MANDAQSLLDPALKTAIEAALQAKAAYRQAEAKLIEALAAQGLIPQLPGEPNRDYHRRVRQTARDWLAMHEDEREWISGL